MSDSSAATQSHGPGPFITHRIQTLPQGGLLVAISRLHRKGHAARTVASYSEIQRIPATHAAAFGHLFFPRRLGWWVALLFAIGSSLFLVGALAANWPGVFPALLQDGEVLGTVFFSGSIFFTTAAWLQWLEALNRDVADAFDGVAHRWRWFGWLLDRLLPHWHKKRPCPRRSSPTKRPSPTPVGRTRLTRFLENGLLGPWMPFCSSTSGVRNG